MDRMPVLNRGLTAGLAVRQHYHALLGDPRSWQALWRSVSGASSTVTARLSTAGRHQVHQRRSGTGGWQFACEGRHSLVMDSADAHRYAASCIPRFLC